MQTRTMRCSSCLPLVITAICLGGPVAPAVELPAGGNDLITEKAWLAATLARGPDANASLDIVDATGSGFTQALRIITTTRPQKPWDIRLTATTTGDIARGDSVLIAFWMRTLASADESGDGVVSVKVQQNEPPHQGLGDTVTASKEWRHCLLPASARWALPAGGHHLEIHLGGWPQTIEIGGLRIINYQEKPLGELPFMKTTYAGREADASWRAEAADRIERLRKGDLMVQVRDVAGKPIPNATVQVRMQRHAFGFGCVMNLGAFELEGPDGDKYRELFATYFNKAPTEAGFRWPTWERNTPEWRAECQASLERTLTWLAQHDIEIRGHYLMWAPIEARNKPVHLIDKPEELLAAKWLHAQQMATWAGTRVSEWDAVNHIVATFGGKRFDQVCQGGNQVYADMITKGRTWAPHAEMWVNEGQILVGNGDRLPDYKAIIADLIARGAKPDGIGFMAHFRDSQLPPPTEVWRRLQEFAPFDCKLQLTELDVGGGADEHLHADYLRDVMTVAFSHPQMDGIVLWGFWESRHWRPSAALWRKDWSIKPAGEAWVELVRKTWWTDAQGATDASGGFTTRGFLGDYALTVLHLGRTATGTVTLTAAGAAATLTLTDVGD